MYCVLQYTNFYFLTFVPKYSEADYNELDMRSDDRFWTEERQLNIEGVSAATAKLNVGEPDENTYVEMVNNYAIGTLLK